MSCVMITVRPSLHQNAETPSSPRRPRVIDHLHGDPGPFFGLCRTGVTYRLFQGFRPKRRGRFLALQSGPSARL